MSEKKDYAKGRYTTIKYPKELGELFDKWIERRPFLGLMNLDNRSGAFQWILTQLLIKDGLIDDTDINLDD